MDGHLQKLLDLHKAMVQDPKKFLDFDSEEKRAYYEAIKEVERRLKTRGQMMSAINEFERDFPELYQDDVKDGHLTLTMPVEIWEDLLESRRI